MTEEQTTCKLHLGCVQMCEHHTQHSLQHGSWVLAHIVSYLISDFCDSLVKYIAVMYLLHDAVKEVESNGEIVTLTRMVLDQDLDM